MELARCPNGHFYDKEKFEQCPICKDSGGIQEKVRTIQYPPKDSNKKSSYEDCPFCDGKRLPRETVLRGLNGTYSIIDTWALSTWRGMSYTACRQSDGRMVIVEQYYRLSELNLAGFHTPPVNYPEERTCVHKQFYYEGETLASPADINFYYHSYLPAIQNDPILSSLVTVLDYTEWKDTECFILDYKEGPPFYGKDKLHPLKMMMPVSSGPADAWLQIWEGINPKSSGLCFPLKVGRNYLVMRGNETFDIENREVPPRHTVCSVDINNDGEITVHPYPAMLLRVNDSMLFDVCKLAPFDFLDVQGNVFILLANM